MTSSSVRTAIDDGDWSGNLGSAMKPSPDGQRRPHGKPVGLAVCERESEAKGTFPDAERRSTAKCDHRLSGSPPIARRITASRALRNASNSSIRPTSRSTWKRSPPGYMPIRPTTQMANSTSAMVNSMSTPRAAALSRRRPASCSSDVIATRGPHLSVRARTWRAPLGTEPASTLQVGPAETPDRASSRAGKREQSMCGQPPTATAKSILLVSHDHEDGGPTIQLPAAGTRRTLRLL